MTEQGNRAEGRIHSGRLYMHGSKFGDDYIMEAEENNGNSQVGDLPKPGIVEWNGGMGSWEAHIIILPSRVPMFLPGIRNFGQSAVHQLYTIRRSN